MSMETVFEVIKWAAILLLGGLSLYFKSKAALTEKVSGLIVQAEDTYKSATKSGGQKMNWVVDHLYIYVPIWLRPLITRSVIERIVQFVFDNIEAYAKMQLDKLVDAIQAKGALQ